MSPTSHSGADPTELGKWGGMQAREGSSKAQGPRVAGDAPISVLVADDHPIMREHVAGAVRADQRLTLIDEACDGSETVQKAIEHRPDTVVLDIAMPVLDGADVLRKLRELGLSIRVLLLPGHASIAQMRDALRQRPDSLLFMNEDVEAICEELVAIGGDAAVSPGRINLERAQMLAGEEVELTARERDVLRLSAEGLTRAETGRQMNLALSTVRDVRRDIRTKLGAQSMQVAVVVALRTGLLE